MKNRRICAVLLFAAAALTGCEYDDSQLRKEVKDLQDRMDKLETWCNDVNNRIGLLQGLVTALEEQDFVVGVTSVMENGKEVGYTITFTKSAPITILHGREGAKGDKGDKGDTGTAPVIGVKQDTDGNYYWTVKTGEGEPVWMTDAAGQKIPTAGKTPVVSVAEFEGVLYWQIDGEWLLSNGSKVPATGEPGDSVFAENGVDTTDPENVTFALADGTTITLPRATTVTVGFDSYDTFCGSPADCQMALVLPATLREDDYTAIAATVTGDNGVGGDVVTRATGDTWGVKVTEPTFVEGKPVAGSARVTLTPPADTKLAETALLRVAITDRKGHEYAVSRPVKWFDGTIVENTAGGLSAAVTDPSVTGLAIVGSVDAADFVFIRASLTALEVLDLSMTDLAAMPDRGLAFYGAPNTTLRCVLLPEGVAAIEEAAFANCHALESIDTEGAQRIGQWAFENCHALQKVQLGDKLEEIANSAFMNCTSLMSIDIPASVHTLGSWVFQGCHALETVTLREGLQNLSESTFRGSGIVSLRIPTTVTEIPAWAFQKCTRLERITLHDGITEIRMRALAKCRSLRIPADNSSLVLPTSLSVIGDGAFEGCRSLEYVKMTDTQVTTIPSNMFINCTSLIQVQLPAGLQQIGVSAFSQCSSMTSIHLPATIASIGEMAFLDCGKLGMVICKAATPPVIESGTFDSKYKANRMLFVPTGADYSAWSAYFDRIYANQ